MRSFFGIERGAASKLEPITAREWGRRQAAASPVWSDEQWRCACALLRVNLTQSRTTQRQHDEHDQDQDDAGAGWAVAA